ncbi:MAG: adenosylcobinamide-GDP ribazoletransferase, partial [Candidatus Omnitrophica bacterium]|nr:adenosylcobinamide-GDP ribazoletransferase [Candidatus Omnitrophota bacterium]
MIHFILALQFLTVFPVRIKNIRKEQFAASLTYFPLVGLGLGLILAGSYRLLSLLRVEESALSGIAVVLLIILTGALHLDGLADTCDAFLSRKNRGQMLAIMRDSHIGAMGVIGLTS